MRHKFDDPLDIHVKHEHDFDKEDVEDLINKATTSVVIIIGVATAARILKRWLA